MAGEKKNNVPTADGGPSWLNVPAVDEEEVHARLEALDEVTSATEATLRGLMEQLSLRSGSAVHFPRMLQVVDAALQRFQRLRMDITLRNTQLVREEGTSDRRPEEGTQGQARPGKMI